MTSPGFRSSSTSHGDVLQCLPRSWVNSRWEVRKVTSVVPPVTLPPISVTFHIGTYASGLIECCVGSDLFVVSVSKFVASCVPAFVVGIRYMMAMQHMAMVL